MKVDREAISRFVYQLQNQNIVPVWSLASEEAIYSAAVGKPAAWGPKALRLRALLRLADKLLLADFVLLLIGFMVAVQLWWKVRKDRSGSPDAGQVNRVFVGFGANSEEKLWDWYRRESDRLPIRINQSSCEGMSSLGCPSLMSIFQVLVREIMGYSARLKGVVSLPPSHRHDFLTACGMGAGIYAFNRVFWEMVRNSGVTEATFLAADIPAFACIEAGVPATYLQHGLISLTILMPRFRRIEALTADEEKYLRSLDCDAHISSVAEGDPAGAKENLMLLLSVDDTPLFLTPAKRIVAWANQIGIAVVVRPVPRFHKTSLVDRLKDHLPGASFDVELLSIEESIARYKPKYVVAWTSTALATALSFGCLPISLCDPDEHDGIQRMVYPMRHRALFWPRDEHLMAMAAHSEQVVVNTVGRLREYRDTALDWVGRLEQGELVH